MNIIVYGKPGCSFCVKAKNLCESRGVPYSYKTVGSDITKEQLQEHIGGPVKTVPQIFLMESGFAEYIGGYEELKRRLGN